MGCYLWTSLRYIVIVFEKPILEKCSPQLIFSLNLNDTQSRIFLKLIITIALYIF